METGPVGLHGAPARKVRKAGAALAVVPLLQAAGTVLGTPWRRQSAMMIRN